MYFFGYSDALLFKPRVFSDNINDLILEGAELLLLAFVFKDRVLFTDLADQVLLTNGEVVVDQIVDAVLRYLFEKPGRFLLEANECL